MNKIANDIKNTLSLRPPQAESLEILAEIADVIELKKNVDLTETKNKIKSLGQKFEETQKFTDFERAFPNICFALATGVGKTRLMGAFVTYLHLAKGIKNFLIIAPRTTVYKKLIDDFSESSNPKYVFRGISKFVSEPPFIVTGETYNNSQTNILFKDSIQINIFNIDKINKKEKGKDGENTPRIRRLSEYLGESFFDYLKNLPDLVMLMDESHHYRANAAMRAIGELNPVLGIEVTATPQTESESSTKKFKNVVYEYSLAKALKDGYCKHPAVATRENTDFDKLKLPEEEEDKLKLRDGVSFHEITRCNLEAYAMKYNKPIIRPFVLVVAKNTAHADKLEEYIKSDEFFNGAYKDKVMKYHSDLSGTDSNIAEYQLLNLEKNDNKIEIVIHVDKLKEGWDVNNLYTIVPLRKFDSSTLSEQTLGRGLRLPYGYRTVVDILTVIVHKKFKEIIDAARGEDSILRKENLININIDDEEIQEQLKRKELVTVDSNIEKKFHEEKQRIAQITNNQEREDAEKSLETKEAIHSAIWALGEQGLNLNQITKSEVISEMYKQKIRRITNDQNLFKEQEIEQIKKDQESTLKEFYNIKDEFVRNVIEIPRITIMPLGTTEAYFEKFKIDFSSDAIKFVPTKATLLRENLVSGERDTIAATDLNDQQQSPTKQIVTKLMDIPEVDYDNDKVLLFNLAEQVVKYYRSYIPNEGDIKNLIDLRINEICSYLKHQMMKHFHKGETKYDSPKINPFIKIEPHYYTQIQGQQLFDYRDNVVDKLKIKSMLFTNFKKACHNIYQFDSYTEKTFSIILEKAPEVLKWLKPTANQFNISWFDGSDPHKYEPDFVVETENNIYLIETKKASSMNDQEVEEKAKAACLYCRNATEYNLKNNGKPWIYVLLPHDLVKENMSFGYLVNQYKKDI